MKELKTPEARILAGAKELISQKKFHYVCTAVNEFAFISNAEREVTLRVLDRICYLLNGKPTLESWVCSNFDKTPESFFQKEKMRRTRLLWIDDMINYWESQNEHV
jgi:hypothetical protein